MTIRVAINGFGRIGRGVLRALTDVQAQSRQGAAGADAQRIELVAVNDLTDAAALAQLYNFDSVYGRAPERLRVEGDALVLGESRITVLAERDPSQLPWADLGIDVVLESTGRFTARDDAAMHLTAGARRVLVSAPGSGADVTIVRGVNDSAFNPDEHFVVSSASCTTNALAPAAMVLHNMAEIQYGYMTTAHAYTQDQNLLDGPHRDPRRARSAALNMVPTSTGAARAIGHVLPELSGKLFGDAIRVPIPVGSLVLLNAQVTRHLTPETIKEQYREVAEGPLRGIVEYSEDALVSSDIVGNPASSIFDAGLLHVHDNQVRVAAWYDNEWGFSHRVVETLALIGT